MKEAVLWLLLLSHIVNGKKIIRCRWIIEYIFNLDYKQGLLNVIWICENYSHVYPLQNLVECEFKNDCKHALEINLSVHDTSIRDKFRTTHCQFKTLLCLIPHTMHHHCKQWCNKVFSSGSSLSPQQWRQHRKGSGSSPLQLLLLLTFHFFWYHHQRYLLPLHEEMPQNTITYLD